MNAEERAGAGATGWAQAVGREWRLGLVLFGGVSLAVYENGVAQELYRAARGRGAWGALRRRLATDVLIDIVSGTSAGGINGLLLGFALANGRDFAATAALWHEDADFSRLLRPLADPDANSLLDSRGYFQTCLERAFAGMPPVPAGETARLDELDVFVTGTNAYGWLSTVFDDKGDVLDVKDYHAFFQLSWRDDGTPGGARKNEFQPDAAHIVGLAKLARVTSAFPVAFEPVGVPEAEPASNEAAADALLDRWGRLQLPNSEVRRGYFLDGGLLENKPFTSALDAIFRRTVDRPSQRYLFYVEPDPERFRPIAEPPLPNVVVAARDALIGIPGYQSIGGDLAAIARHNDGVVRHDAIVAGLSAQIAQQPRACGTLAELRAAAPPGFLVYWRCRLMQIRDGAVAGLLHIDGRREWFQGAARLRGRALVAAFNAWAGPLDDAIERFDIFYRRRRAAHLIYRLLAAPLEEADAQRRILALLNHHFQTLEIVQSAMDDLLRRSNLFPLTSAGDGSGAINAEAVWRQVMSLLDRLLNPAGLALPEDAAGRIRFAAALDERKRTLLAQTDAAPAAASGDNLLLALDAWLFAHLREHSAAAPAVWGECQRFLEIDALLFPLEASAEQPGHDLIRTVRISPYDVKYGLSQRGLWKGQLELAGAQLDHFGAFLKRSWRANDMLWGRLDAAAILLECMLESSVSPEEIERQVRLVQAEILAELLPQVRADEAAESPATPAATRTSEQQFSPETYHVGEQRWEDAIPRRRRWHWAAQTALRLRSSLLASLPADAAARAAGSWLLRAIFAPFWLLYKFTKSKN